MKKYYKVNLYKVDKVGGCIIQIVNMYKPIKVDEIIVEYNSFSGKCIEIMTKLNINIYKDSCIEEGKLVEKYHCYSDLYNYGFQLFTLLDDYVEKNRINEKELDSYVDSFDKSKYKEVYDQLKILTNKEKRNIKNKIKGIKGMYK